MSRWLREAGATWRARPLVIGLDAQCAAWQLPGEPAVRSTAPADLGADLAGRRVLSMLLVASPDIAVHWVQPPAAAASLQELRQVAQVRCSQLFGGTPVSWRVAGDWHAGHPFACAALPESFASTVEGALAPLDVPLHWQTAWGLLGAHAPQRFPGNGWSVLRTPRRLMVWECRDGRPQSLACLHAAPGASSEALAAQAWGHVQLASAGAAAAAQVSHCSAATCLSWLDLCTAQAPSAPGIVPVSATGLSTAGAAVEAQAVLALARHLGVKGV